jgi:hypothetical protein
MGGFSLFLGFPTKDSVKPFRVHQSGIVHAGFDTLYKLRFSASIYGLNSKDILVFYGLKCCLQQLHFSVSVRDAPKNYAQFRYPLQVLRLWKNWDRRRIIDCVYHRRNPSPARTVKAFAQRAVDAVPLTTPPKLLADSNSYPSGTSPYSLNIKCDASLVPLTES